MNIKGGLVKSGRVLGKKAKLFALITAIWAIASGFAYKSQIHQDVYYMIKGVESYPELREANKGVWLIPENVFFKAGYTKGGDWSVMRMLEMWRAAGMTPDQSVNLIAFFYSDLLPAVVHPDVYEYERMELQKKEGRIAFIFPAAYRKLQGMNHETSVVPIDWSMRDDSEENMFWVELLGEINSLNPEMTSLNQKRASISDAQDEIARVVAVSGLRKLNLPMLSWNDSVRLMDISAGVEQSNKDLISVTGWSGGVLGLNGRLNLTLGTLDGSTVNSGGLGGNGLKMETDWQDLSHEWLHALDFVMARELIPYPRPVSLTAHKESWLRNLLASEEVKHWWEVSEMFDKKKSAWTRRRADSMNEQELAKFDIPKEYWLNPSEIMAFAWEARLNKMGQLKLINSKGIVYETDPHGLLMPSFEEMKPAENAWIDLMDSSSRTLKFKKLSNSMEIDEN